VKKAKLYQTSFQTGSLIIEKYIDEVVEKALSFTALR
jgi:hypothetical protein